MSSKKEKLKKIKQGVKKIEQKTRELEKSKDPESRQVAKKIRALLGRVVRFVTNPKTLGVALTTLFCTANIISSLEAKKRHEAETARAAARRAEAAARQAEAVRAAARQAATNARTAETRRVNINSQRGGVGRGGVGLETLDEFLERVATGAFDPQVEFGTRRGASGSRPGANTTQSRTESARQANAASEIKKEVKNITNAIRELDLEEKKFKPTTSPGEHGARFSGLDLDGMPIRLRKKRMDYGVKGMKKGEHVMARDPEYVKRLKEGGGGSEPSAAPNANNREKLKKAAKIAAGVAGAAGLVGGAYLAHKYGLDKKLGNMAKGAASKAGDFALRGAGKAGANYLIAKHAAKGAARKLGRSIKGATAKAGDFALRGAGKAGANYLIAKHAAKGAARKLGRSIKGATAKAGQMNENVRRGNSINAARSTKKSSKGTGWDVLRNRKALKRALNNPNHVWDI